MMEYPTDKELERIEKWLHQERGLIDFVRSLWEYADVGYFVLDGNKLELHTGGWSGNEDIIEALKSNFIFWNVTWRKSERGGHYYFILEHWEPINETP